MGLGLQIVRRILELHGSRLELEDSAHGARLRFELRAAAGRPGEIDRRAASLRLR
jgi:nitrogen fixation/metabolism regulation signal transduction histidine kinase